MTAITGRVMAFQLAMHSTHHPPLSELGSSCIRLYNQTASMTGPKDL